MGRGVPSQLGGQAAAVHDWLGMQGLSARVVFQLTRSRDACVTSLSAFDRFVLQNVSERTR